MASGSVHDRTTCLLSLPFGLLWWPWLGPSGALGAGLAFLVGGLWLSPDLDTRSNATRRWGWLRWLWWPYRRGLSHRSVLSHSPLLGSTGRLLYLALWITLLSWLLQPLGAPSPAAMGEGVALLWQRQRPLLLAALTGWRPAAGCTCSRTATRCRGCPACCAAPAAGAVAGAAEGERVGAAPPPFPMSTDPLPALAALVAVVDQLRDPERGCPWDLEQTHTSLIPYVLEEAHEVADAIRHGDDRHLQEELGDLLLQVVLHARLAAEEGRFDLEAVARGIHDKLVRRHPHVFAPEATGATTGVAGDSAAVRRSWEAIKAAEAAAREPAPSTSSPPSSSPLSDRLAGKVRGQPALAGAMTISRRAAAAGFEWDDMAGVWGRSTRSSRSSRRPWPAVIGGTPRRSWGMCSSPW